MQSEAEKKYWKIKLRSKHLSKNNLAKKRNDQVYFGIYYFAFSVKVGGFYLLQGNLKLTIEFF